VANEVYEKRYRELPSIAVPVSIFFNADFAGEGAVDKNEVAGGEHHAHDPPDQADLEAVVGGFRTVDRQRVDGIACGKNHWKHAKDDAGKHAGYVEA